MLNGSSDIKIMKIIALKKCMFMLVYMNQILIYHLFLLKFKVK